MLAAREASLMPKPPDRTRIDPRRAAADALFKPKPPEGPAEAPSLPGAREMVSLRIDHDVLEHFREGGPGWQDRINEALKKIVAAQRS